MSNNLYTNVHSSIVHRAKGGNNQNVQMLENELGFIHGIPLNNKKEQITDPHNRGESQSIMQSERNH